MSTYHVRHVGSSSPRNFDQLTDVNVTHLGTVTPRKFDQLLDVNMTGVADGNLVAYDASTKTFIPYVGSGNVPSRLSITDIIVSGISTFGSVLISSGIVTSTNPGITTVVYYGDGSKLTGIGGISTSSVNITGGLAGNILYQSAPGITTFITNGTNGQVLTFNGTIPIWSNPTGGGGSVNLTYDPITREIDSSTGTGAILPLAGQLVGGVPVAGLFSGSYNNLSDLPDLTVYATSQDFRSAVSSWSGGLRYHYIGSAAPGTAEGSNGWTVRRLTENLAGVITATAIATGSWSNYQNLTYS
jgi:hypothetical protein